MTVPASPLPGADLHEVVARAVEREGHLLTAGELHVCRQILALEPAALELYARLTLRTGEAFRVASLRYEVADAWPRLVAAGLLHRAVPDDRAAEDFDVPALKAACARLGLPRTGNRDVIVERLKGQRWVDEPVVMVAHRRLIRRLERLSGIDRQLLVAERMEHLRWPEYTPTGGAGLFPDRRSLRTWERARRGEWTDPEEPLRLARLGPAPFGLSPFAYAVEAVLAQTPGADVLAQLPGQAPRLALALEREGRGVEALAVCRAGDPDPAVNIALGRTGKRLARSLGRPWPPTPPLREAPVRRLRLARAGKAARPTWGEEALTIEAALIRELTAAGRVAAHTENWLWTSLYSLVFRDLYFLPIPGRLPTARRGGPIDLGTPSFYTARREPIERRLEELRERGPGAFVEGWQGERLDGLWLPERVLPLVRAVPGPTAAVVLGRLAREGWAAGRGLPDLFVLPGPEVRLDEAIPARLDPIAILAEVKGPTDSLRDEQRVWLDVFLSEAIRVEVWEVTEK